MSNLTQFAVGNRPSKNIVNDSSTSGFALRWVTGNTTLVYGAQQILSGALTANTLKTVLSITGSGTLDFLAAIVMDSTSRSLRARATIDGIVVFDSTSAAGVSSVGAGCVIAGGRVLSDVTTNSMAIPSGNVIFNSSLLIEVASSLTETDKLAIYTSYKTF